MQMIWKSEQLLILIGFDFRSSSVIILLLNIMSSKNGQIN